MQAFPGGRNCLLVVTVASEEGQTCVEHSRPLSPGALDKDLQDLYTQLLKWEPWLSPRPAAATDP